MDKSNNQKTTLCPSSNRPDLPNSIVFGIINGTVDKPHVTYLKKPQPVTEELMALAAPVTPAEVFRTATTCATNKCLHFDGNNCRLAQRVVDQFPVVEDKLPACSIRRDCRWFQQEGKAACMRCPQVITDNYNASELVRQVSMPTAIGE
ncbi:nitrogen fixation protein [Crocosphaera sp.]|uniref:nitrogen fixation protein n=1 Tax=Crocosphaera sp. TaxID=2729996 RepID=UPI003F2563F8|nr:nitrogen fixation protein [Crocosphaera sp.]